MLSIEHITVWPYLPQLEHNFLFVGFLWIQKPCFLKQIYSLSPILPQCEHVTILMATSSFIYTPLRKLPITCVSCCITYEKIFEMEGMRSIKRTQYWMLPYCSFKPRGNGWYSCFFCAIIEIILLEHFTSHNHIGSRHKLLSLSYITWSLVKNFVTILSPNLNEPASF